MTKETAKGRVYELNSIITPLCCYNARAVTAFTPASLHAQRRTPLGIHLGRNQAAGALMAAHPTTTLGPSW
jgi:hypothetical protein